MTPVAELTPSLSVAGQIQPEDVQALAEHGYQVIMCNRPDNEEPNQPSMDAIAAACELAGIQFVRYPVDAMSFPGDDLDAMDEAMNGDEKVLAYCRSARDRPIYGLRRLPVTRDSLLPNEPSNLASRSPLLCSWASLDLPLINRCTQAINARSAACCSDGSSENSSCAGGKCSG